MNGDIKQLVQDEVKTQIHQLLHPEIEIIRLSDDAIIPTYKYDHDAGFDLHSIDSLILSAFDPEVDKIQKIRTGIAVHIPPGYEAQIRSRSGLAYKREIFVLNSPGTIDSGYTGEIEIILCNLSGNDFEINIGERIAQMVISPVCKARLNETKRFTDTARGSNGFGSTGV